jgi:hypothetical protein
VVSAVLALTTLTACTPEGRLLLAVRPVAGEPVLLLAGCTDFLIDRIHLRPENDGAAASPGRPERELDRTGAVVPDSMPLLGDPVAGWTVVEDGVAALAPGRRYSLYARTAEGDETVPITFADTDLAALGPDEVLVGKVPSSYRTMTEGEFREQAEEAC